MVTRRQNSTVWVVVVMAGFLMLVSAPQVSADCEPKQPAAADKATEKAVEKPAKTAGEGTAKKPAAKKTEAVADKPAEKPSPACKKADKAKSADKAKPEKSKQKKKGSLLRKLMGAASGKKTVEGTLKGEAEKAAKKKDKKKAKAAKKVPRIVRLKVTGSYPESPEAPSPFGAQRRSLNSLLRKFEKLSEDKNVAAVLLEIETLGLGSGKTCEIRQAIGRLRAGGKPVYGVLTSADSGRYLLASACDEVLMVPSGVIVIPGVRAEVTFYKGLLNKIGIQFEVLQMGKYKGAGEPLSRTKMSKPLRESLESLVDDRYEWLVETVAKDRKMEDYKVKTLIDQAFFTAGAAKKAGLVDQVVYTDAFLKRLPKKLKVKNVKVVSAYKERRADMEVSGIGGMMKLMQMMMGGKPAAKTSGKKIAVVYAVGAIMEGKSTDSPFFGKVLGSTTLVEALKKAADDPKVAAVVLRVDSPGGSAVASDLIWREIVRMKKPVIASMGNVAASGGYYISMGADEIYAEPGTVTGSIGVIGGKFVMAGLYKKIGLTTEIISRGKNSGSLSSTQPFTPEEREALMAILRTIYRQFVSKAARGRKMSYAELHELAQGRVYSGQAAKELGLIDRLGTLHDAVAAAKKAAGLKKDEKVELLILPRPKTFFEKIFEDPSASADAAVMAAAGPMADPLRQAAVLRRLFAEPVLLWMPYKIELK